MKKLLLLVIAFTIISCDKDEVTSTTVEPQSYILPKKISVFDSNDILKWSFSLEYEGNKPIKGYTNGELAIEYEYDGDKIVNVHLYDENNIKRTNMLSYQGDDLEHFVLAGNTERTSYFYSQGVLETEKYMGSVDGESWHDVYTTSYTFENSNVVKTIKKDDINQAFADIVSQYEYDSKNNPFLNCNKHFRYLIDLSGIIEISENNLTKKISADGYNRSYDIDYDSNDYPVEIRTIPEFQFGTIPLGEVEETLKIEY